MGQIPVATRNPSLTFVAFGDTGHRPSTCTRPEYRYAPGHKIRSEPAQEPRQPCNGRDSSDSMAQIRRSLRTNGNSSDSLAQDIGCRAITAAMGHDHAAGRDAIPADSPTPTCFSLCPVISV
jgi:hypothetical protein